MSSPLRVPHPSRVFPKYCCCSWETSLDPVHFATTLRKMFPFAMGRRPPSFLTNPIMFASKKNVLLFSGTLLFAIICLYSQGKKH